MVKITRITPSTIELKGIHFGSDGDKIDTIMDICHRFKHIYKDGYPYGRKTRKKRGERLEKWSKCPGICFTYLVTNDTRGHNLEIVVLVSDEEKLLERYTKEEIENYKQMYTQDVADAISKEFNIL